MIYLRRQETRQITICKKVEQGSITVFLTLILLLVISLVCTVIESARIQSSRSLGQSYMTAGVESVFSSYQRELFDQYKIFAYQLDTTQGETSPDKIGSELSQYIGKALEYNNVDVFDLYNLQLDSTQVNNTTMLTDYDGKLFLNQVLAYMKYSAPTELVKELCEKWNLYESTEKTSTVMKKRLQTQESLAELSKDMLKLMEQVEGIDTNENGVRTTKSGTIKVKSSYAKRVITESPRKEVVGINKELVYVSLKQNYYNISSEIDNCINLMKNAIACNEMIEKLEKEKESLEQEKSTLEIEIANQAAAAEDNSESAEDKGELDSKGEETKENTTSPEQQRLSEVESAITNIVDQIDKEEDDRNTYIRNCNEIKDKVVKACSSTVDMIDQSLVTINKIDKKRVDLTKTVEGYEEVLIENSESIGEETYKEFQDDLAEMKSYIGIQEENEDLSAACAVEMRGQLQVNKSILEQISTSSVGNINEDIPQLMTWKSIFESQKSHLVNYTVANLQFDYKSLVIQEDVKSPADSMTELLENGILNLVIEDTNKISSAEIAQNELPSTLERIESDKDADCTSLLRDCKGNEYNSDIANTFNTDTSVVNELVQSLLLNQYQMDYFSNYVDVTSEEENKDNEKEADKNTKTEKSDSTKLIYEQEYMLAGKDSDKANLTNVASRIILLRTIINCVYVFSDKQKNASAYATAAALVGFTCLAPLVTLMKFVILFTWAMEEAIVDTYALLDGRSVPFFKTKSSFKVSYNDLLTLSRTKIKQLASKYSEDTHELGCFSYQHYLRIFLMLNGIKKNCYRTMDVIQINMQQQLGKQFFLSNCMYGMEVNATFTIPEKFVAFPFIKEIIGQTKGSYSFNVKTSSAY